jgi:hypothetical protein
MNKHDHCDSEVFILIQDKVGCVILITNYTHDLICKQERDKEKEIDAFHAALPLLHEAVSSPPAPT